jgi:hypothetical protein
MLWLLAMFAGIGLMIWLLPPRGIKVIEPTALPLKFQAKPPPLPKYDEICPTWGPCWRDGKPISGSL